jgi:hypothetical protein
VSDKSKWLALEQLLEGEAPVTFINEPRESATARAMRRWFKRVAAPSTNTTNESRMLE